ncbi:MAG: amidohydrolase family protein [Bacteroidota bacterium]|nr:amidohydrolase family protein [Bacteroidota bacterium]
MSNKSVKRRDFFRYIGIGTVGIGLSGAVPTGSGIQEKKPGNLRKTITQKVFSTPLIDTHEHLIDEKDRLGNRTLLGTKSNDWTYLFSHYLDSDMLSAGMPAADYKRFFSANVDPIEKWKILEHVWPKVKHTGYAQAVRISIKELYGIEELSEESIPHLQKAYQEMVAPGFYKKILQEKGNIESCQVNSYPILKSEMPDFLMSDLWADSLMTYVGNNDYAKAANIDPKSLNDWHRVIDWWFEKYGKYVVAIKIGQAYSRGINFDRIPYEEAEPVYNQVIQGKQVTPEEKKKLEDHLFWHVVGQATKWDLPVKMHLGYHAQWAGKTNQMDLAMVRNNPADAGRLCDESKETRFIFFHISYPYYEEMLAVAKQFANATIDMCWAWIINPVAAKDFLKKFIVTVPSNKILTFGGDYTPVEPVLGHSIIARNGIALALSELVEENHISLMEALALVDPLLNGNAREIFRLEKKQKLLKNLNWNTL